METDEVQRISRVQGAAHRFWFLVTANYIAWIGSVTTLIVVPFYVLETTGRAFDAGLAGAANTLPMALGGILGGAVVDRIGPRIAGIVAGMAGAFCIASVPVFDAMVGLPFGVLLMLLFLRSLFDTPTAAARLSLLSALADEAGYSRDTANAIFQAGQRVALIVGPPFAAFLIAQWGAILTLYVDAIAFAVAALLLLFSAAKAKPHIAAQGEALINQFAGGVRIIYNNKQLLSLIQIFIVTNLIEDAFAPVILPVYARELLNNPLQVSYPIIFFGVGALIGTFAYIPISRLVHTRFSVFIGCLIVIALSRVALIANLGIVWLASLSFLVGVASGPFNPIITILVQNSVPAEALGRTFGALIGIAFAAIPLGIFLAGFFVELFGLQGTLVIYGTVYIVITIYAVKNKVLRTM
jgi:MFS family permease